jgi:hypothetical protein
MTGINTSAAAASTQLRLKGDVSLRSSRRHGRRSWRPLVRLCQIAIPPADNELRQAIGDVRHVSDVSRAAASIENILADVLK